MSAQHATGGPVGGDKPGTLARPLAGFDFPGNESATRTEYEQWRDAAPERRDAAQKQGTPLGRIVLGVFLGLLAWSLFCAVVAGILLITILRGIGDSSSAGITDTNLPTPGSGTLSQPCEDAYINGDDLTIPCAGDNPALVKELTGS